MRVRYECRVFELTSHVRILFLWRDHTGSTRWSVGIEYARRVTHGYMRRPVWMQRRWERWEL